MCRVSAVRGADMEMRPVDAGDGFQASENEQCQGVPNGSQYTSDTVTISVQLPELATSMDFGLLVDVSYSYE